MILQVRFYAISWTNAAVNRSTNELTTASIELFRNGDVAVTTKDEDVKCKMENVKAYKEGAIKCHVRISGKGSPTAILHFTLYTLHSNCDPPETPLTKPEAGLLTAGIKSNRRPPTRQDAFAGCRFSSDILT